MKTAEDVLMKWQTKWEMDSSDCPKSHRDMVKVAMEEYAQEIAKNLHKPLANGCVCTPEESIGWTTVKCCNQCGLPIEKFWCKH